ncbi:MAG: 2-dehydropantoate 2-reductase [Candidatus Eremiobacteraeota bacterium]|nr:2-dehydropantoate 2-reductase [Candidatus Eremiobacteraeota bacterium]
MELQRGRKLRIGILGAGAQGTLFGWHLAELAEVTFLDISPELCAAIERDGVRLQGEGPRRAAATLDASVLFSADLLFAFVKAHDTLRAFRHFAGRLNPSAPIVTLQNGLGNEEAIKTALGGNVALVVGITSETAVSRGEGVAQRIGRGRTVVGGAGATSATVERVAALLSGAGLETQTAYDIRPHLWGKLIATAAINPISALLDRENGVIVDDSDAGALARSIALEAAAVAQAMAIKLPFADVWGYVREIVEQTAAVESTMAYDLAAGRRTEVEQINGAIVATGRRAGIPTPYNDAVLRLIKARERRLAALAR